MEEINEKLTFPEIVRAREFYVYDKAGNRYLDLYLGGGRLALGHRLPHRLQLIKSLLARGLFGNYPHSFEDRLKKACQAFWGEGLKIYGFRDRHSAETFLEENKGLTRAPELWESNASDLCFARWRLGQATKTLGISCWQFQAPVPSFLGYMTFFIQQTGEEGVELNLMGEPWDSFSVRLVEQSLYALVRERAEPASEPKSTLGEGLFRREGQAWLPLYDEKEHNKVWMSFKEKGILLPLSYREPLTIPRSLTKEDWKRFRRAQDSYLEKT